MLPIKNRALRGAANFYMYGVLILIAISPSPASVVSISQALSILGVWLAVCLVGAFLVPLHVRYDQAVRHNRLASTMAAVMRGTHGPFLLLLRPFDADGHSLHSHALPFNRKVVPWRIAAWAALRAGLRGSIEIFLSPRMILVADQEDRLVVRVNERLECRLPVVGIGGYFNVQPSVFLADGNEWKVYFRNLAEAAEVVVMIPHWSEGCGFELSFLKQEGILQKVIFLQSPQFSDVERWNVLRQHVREAHGLEFPPGTRDGCVFVCRHENSPEILSPNFTIAALEAAVAARSNLQ